MTSVILDRAHSATTGLVVDDHRLAQIPAHGSRDRPSDDIGRAAGGVGDKDAQRLRGGILSLRERGECG